MIKKFEILTGKVRQNKTLRTNTIYVIRGEVQVLKGVRVNAQDRTTILLENGTFKNSRLKRSALIFNPGSILNAKNITLKASNSRNQPVKVADNGGIWFLGSSFAGSKDGISIKPQKNSPPSKFLANSINTKYLGKSDGKTERGDDIDGISILGVARDEWLIKKISSHHSGDDAIDVTNSHISLETIEVKSPAEDGINLSSSRLEIHRKLSMDTTKTGIRDRDLFDFEVDDGASYLEIYRGCIVDLHGVFGDQLVLSSEEMPKPVTKMGNQRTYSVYKKLKKSALIFSIDKD